jgi:hypothetical protein
MGNWIRMRAEYAGNIPASADETWELISDFAGVLRYWPRDDSTPIGITGVDLEGDHKTVPRARHVYVARGVATEWCFKESDTTRRLYYDMNDDGIPGVYNYMATVTVDEDGPEKSVMRFTSDFDIPPDGDRDFYRKRIVAVYESIVTGFLQNFALPEHERIPPTYTKAA